MKIIPFETSIKFPIAPKDWANKFGLYALILIVATAITQGINTVVGITSELSMAGLEEADPAYLLGSLSTVGIQLLIGLSVLPVTLYLAGYIYEVTKNVFDKKKDVWVSHGNIWERITKGFRLAVLNSGPVVALMILATLAFLVGTMLIALGSNPGIVVVIFEVIASVAVFITLFAFMLLMPVISGALYFTYLQTESIKKAYQWDTLKKVMKTMWKEIYVLHFIKTGLLMAASMVAIVACCISFIATPLLAAYVTFVMAYLVGEVYGQFKDTIKVA